MRKTPQRLTLTKETVRSLRPLDLRQVAGGGAAAVVQAVQADTRVEICTLTTHPTN